MENFIGRNTQVVKYVPSPPPPIICKFSSILVKILTGLFKKLNKWILKFIWKKRPKIATVLKKKHEMVELTILIIKINIKL